MGGRCWLLDRKGIFVLERGAGTFRICCCTAAGSGGITVYDGLPDANGFFPDGAMPANDPDYNRRNGRPLLWLHPCVMGAWPVDGGFEHGLTVIATSSTPHSPLSGPKAIATFTWLKYHASQPEKKSPKSARSR